MRVTQLLALVLVVEVIHRIAVVERLLRFRVDLRLSRDGHLDPVRQPAAALLVLVDQRSGWELAAASRAALSSYWLISSPSRARALLAAGLLSVVSCSTTCLKLGAF